jgi:hypothetical protein
MKGWLLVASEVTRSKKDFDGWIKLALESNKNGAASKKSQEV